MKQSRPATLLAGVAVAFALAASAHAAEPPWWNQQKVRFFWGQWGHFEEGGHTTDDVMAALSKVGATVYVNHNPEPTPIQVEHAAVARKHGLRFFGIAYIAFGSHGNQGLMGGAARLNAPLAVDADGNTSSKRPDPFFKPAYEEWLFKPAMEMAKSGLVDGMHVDWEFYGGRGEGRQVYNDEYFNAFLKTKNVTATVPVKGRYRWLVEANLHQGYLEYLRELTRTMFAEFADKVRAIKPDFIFSSYDNFHGTSLENGGWRVAGISAGLHSPDAPYFVIDPRHYFEYHVAPWWNSFYSHHHALGFKHIAGSWDNRFSGGAPQTDVGLVQWIYDVSMNTDGYWLWFEHEFGPSVWLNLAAADRRIRTAAQNIGAILLEGAQDNQFVTLVEQSGNPELAGRLKHRAYHLDDEHLVRVCNVDTHRPLQVRVRFPTLPEGRRWTLRDPVAKLHFSPDGKAAAWTTEQLYNGLVVPFDKRSDQFLLVSPAKDEGKMARGRMLVSQQGMRLGERHFTEPNGDEVGADRSGATRLLFTKTVQLDRSGARAGWVIGSGLYCGDVVAANTQRLRHGQGNFWSPSWSPDRKRILFTQYANGRGQIGVMNPDGTAVANLSSNETCDRLPVWSPDGTRIAFTSDRDGDWEVYVMNADGSGQTQLTSSPGADTAPVWSPDGTKIAFETNRGVDTDIYVMKADGSNRQPIIQLAGDVQGPAWSPDGERIAATCLTPHQRALVLADAQTGRLTIVSDDVQPFMHIEDLQWSPDGRRIGAIFTNKQERDNAGIALFELSAEPGESMKTQSIVGPDERMEYLSCRGLVNVTGIRPHPGGGRKPFATWYAFGSQSPSWLVKTFHGLSWSPDGSQVAFSSDMSQSGEFRVYTTRAVPQSSHDRVGFYLFKIGRIDNVVVHVKGDDGKWKEAFRDDFERADLGEDWKVREGSFGIEAGRLTGSGFIMCERPFAGDPRMEYDASAAPGSTGDLSAFLSSTAQDPWKGVLFAFGSYENKFSKVQIAGEQVARSDTRIVPGKTHRILCERDGVHMRHLIDGKQVHRYTAPANVWSIGAEPPAKPVALPDSTSAWPQQTAW